MPPHIGERKKVRMVLSRLSLVKRLTEKERVSTICASAIFLSAILANAAHPQSFDSTSESTSATQDPMLRSKVDFEQFDEPTSQETHPFLFFGRVMDQTHPRWREYQQSIDNFPDLQSCLTGQKRTASDPYLYSIDWARMRRLQDIDVCVFRIAASYESPQEMEQWLLGQGYVSSGLVHIHGDDYVPKNKFDAIYNLSGNLSVDELDRRTGIYKLKLPVLGQAIRKLGQSHYISISYSQTYQVVQVGAGVTTK